MIKDNKIIQIKKIKEETEKLKRLIEEKENVCFMNKSDFIHRFTDTFLTLFISTPMYNDTDSDYFNNILLNDLGLRHSFKDSEFTVFDLCSVKGNTHFFYNEDDLFELQLLSTAEWFSKKIAYNQENYYNSTEEEIKNSTKKIKFSDYELILSEHYPYLEPQDNLLLKLIVNEQDFLRDLITINLYDKIISYIISRPDILDIINSFEADNDLCTYFGQYFLQNYHGEIFTSLCASEEIEINENHYLDVSELPNFFFRFKQNGSDEEYGYIYNFINYVLPDFYLQRDEFLESFWNDIKIICEEFKVSFKFELNAILNKNNNFLELYGKNISDEYHGDKPWFLDDNGTTNYIYLFQDIDSLNNDLEITFNSKGKIEKI